MNPECVGCKYNFNHKCIEESCVNINPSNITHPNHYTSVVPDIECIQVTQHFNFNRGNAIKYIWRAGQKDKSKEIEDLQKAIQYLEFEITRINEVNK